MMTNERTGTFLLLAATMLVAGSILADGVLARTLNGVAGLTWFAAAGVLARVAWAVSRRPGLWLVVMTLTALVAFVVRPVDFIAAVVGFGAAGVVVALATPTYGVLWAKLVVGLYLPMHIGTAVLKAAWRALTGTEAAIRTEPPPTAALVPFAMFLAAVTAAWAVERARGRQPLATRESTSSAKAS